MFAIKSYYSTIEHLATFAPSLENNPTDFIGWAEIIGDAICFIYTKEYDEFTEDLIEAVKEQQGYEDQD
jgi:hypothetical protein